MKHKLLTMDVIAGLKSLPENSVHCVVTSPPYWQLRQYTSDGKVLGGQLGLETTFDEFISNMTTVFEEVMRVLHPTGVLWVNMGNSYNSKMSRGTYGDQSKHGYIPHGMPRLSIEGMDKKSLIGQSWALAFSLQKAGWILRSDIIWHKPNPMPHSIDDRPISAHEYLFLFSKKPKYFYDAYAVREQTNEFPFFRQRRSVWTIGTQRNTTEHYAAFPDLIPHLCISAGTSGHGVCDQCLKPVKRVLKEVAVTEHGGPRKRADAPGAEVSPTSVFRTGKISVKEHDRWERTCKCENFKITEATVLDPFSGTGTTGVIAARLYRNYIGIDLSPQYNREAKAAIAGEYPLEDFVELV